MNIHHSYRSLLKATLLVLALLPFAASNALAASSNKKDEPVEVLEVSQVELKGVAETIFAPTKKTKNIPKVKKRYFLFICSNTLLYLNYTLYKLFFPLT